jgi:steroid delta-isomerase-like uncharacterized protein
MATDVERIMKDYYAAYNSHDVDGIASLWTDDGFYESVASGAVTRSKEELVASFRASFVAFTDQKFELKSVFSAGDWVASEWVWTGTHAGDWHGLPATGKSSSIRGASIFDYGVTQWQDKP